MWFPSRNKLARADKSTAFILLCCAELFDEAPVPISYSPKLLNSYGLLHEIKDIASNAEQNGQHWKSHIPFLVDELKKISEDDRAIQKYYPEVSHAIRNLPDRGENSVALIHQTAAVALDLIKEYPEKVRGMVREAQKNMPGKKKDMLASLQSLATQSQYEGVPRSQCFEVVSENNLSLSPSEITELIIESSFPADHIWFCIITLKGNENEIKSVIAHHTDFRLLPSKNKPLGRIGKEFLEKTKNTVRIIPPGKIQAGGAFSAILKAVRELRTILDLVNFYRSASPIQIGPYAFASHDRYQKLINLSEHYYSKLKGQCEN